MGKLPEGKGSMARATLALVEGLPPPSGEADAPLGPQAAAFLARTAALWLERARRLDLRVSHALTMQGAALRWEWHEAGSPPGDLGPQAPPEPQPPGLRIRRFVSPGSLGVILDLPPGAQDW